MAALIIKPAEQDEFDAIAQLWWRSWRSIAPQEPGEATAADLLSRINSEIENGWRLFVAKENQTAVGMLALSGDGKRLDQLFVAPAFQQHGIGKALLDYAKTLSPNGLELRAGRSNRRAIVFYERPGFRHVRDETVQPHGRAVSYFRWAGFSEGGHEGR